MLKALFLAGLAWQSCRPAVARAGDFQWFACEFAAGRAFGAMDYRQAEKYYRRALAGLADEPPGGWRRQESARGLAQVLQEQGRLDQAGQIYDQVLLPALKDAPWEQKAKVLLARGRWLCLRKKWTEAEKLNRAALKDLGDFAPPRNLIASGLLVQRGEILSARKRVFEAGQCFSQALELVKQGASGDWNSVWRAVEGLALYFWDTRQEEKALACLRVFTRPCLNLPPTENLPDYAKSKLMAEIFQRHSRFSEAEEMACRAARELETALGPGDSQTLDQKWRCLKLKAAGGGQ